MHLQNRQKWADAEMLDKCLLNQIESVTRLVTPIKVLIGQGQTPNPTQVSSPCTQRGTPSCVQSQPLLCPGQLLVTRGWGLGVEGRWVSQGLGPPSPLLDTTQIDFREQDRPTPGQKARLWKGFHSQERLYWAPKAPR